MSEGGLTLERQLELLEEELRRTRRFAALGELASTTTHEFNNVLTTIINYAKLGLRHKDEATRDKALTKILDASLRAEKITNGVLGMARNRSTDRAPTDLAKLVEESLVLLEREMQKYRVQVELHDRADTAGAGVRQSNSAGALELAHQCQASHAQRRPSDHSRRPRSGQPDRRSHRSATPAAAFPPNSCRKSSTASTPPSSGPDASGKGGTGVGLSMCREIIEAAPRQDPRRKHPRRRHRLHAQAADRPRRATIEFKHAIAAHSAFQLARHLSNA